MTQPSLTPGTTSPSWGRRHRVAILACGCLCVSGFGILVAVGIVRFLLDGVDEPATSQSPLARESASPRESGPPPTTPADPFAGLPTEIAARSTAAAAGAADAAYAWYEDQTHGFWLLQPQGWEPAVMPQGLLRLRLREPAGQAIVEVYVAETERTDLEAFAEAWIGQAAKQLPQLFQAEVARGVVLLGTAAAVRRQYAGCQGATPAHNLQLISLHGGKAYILAATFVPGQTRAALLANDVADSFRFSPPPADTADASAAPVVAAAPVPARAEQAALAQGGTLSAQSDMRSGWATFRLTFPAAKHPPGQD